MDRTIVLQLLVTVGHFKTAVGHQGRNIYKLSNVDANATPMSKEINTCAPVIAEV